MNACEGCAHCPFPGVRWPASPDGFRDKSYVERCDACETFMDDEQAARFVADQLNTSASEQPVGMNRGFLRWTVAHWARDYQEHLDLLLDAQARGVPLDKLVPPYPWCQGYPERGPLGVAACVRAGYCKRNPTCGD